jgi:diguanylate cyclase (GGDEF)-like protein
VYHILSNNKKDSIMKETSSVLRDIKLIRKAEDALEKTENFLKKVKNNKLSLTFEDGVYKVNSDDMNKITRLIADLDKSGGNLADAMELLKELMIYDEITHMFSRRYILNVLEKEIIRSRRYKNDFSLIAFEIDNDNPEYFDLGSETENLLISKIATNIREYKRTSDSAGRTGPHTFLLILPETKEEGAEVLAQRIARDVSKVYEIGDSTINVKVNYAVVDNTQTEKSNLVEIMYMLDNKLATKRK